jgi:probable rRNA maturation factor
MTGGGTPDPPAVTLHNHQSAHPLDLGRIEAAAKAAVPMVLATPGSGTSRLDTLGSVEASFVDDTEIGRVHGEFLGDPTPTDVITFHHGEILISAETAAREAGARDQPVSRELVLYLVHGLLHLHGHTDGEEPSRSAMKAAQERILDSVWPLPTVPASPRTDVRHAAR